MTPTPVLSARGWHGTATFDGAFVIIHRSRTRGRGYGSAETRIPIRQISSINYKPASLLSQGYIEFLSPGAVQHRKPGRTQNSLLFVRPANPAMAALRDAVYAAQSRLT